MIDDKGIVVVDHEWSEKGDWEYQELEENEKIIGLYGCKSKSETGFIRSLGFIVRTK